ncbi:MAG: protein translocase subunit SecD [Candidatus Omnitrophica bacterium]|nr:protein translocase subunit SecD [Candidatus Omnitrophota bacterium]
MDKYFKWKVLFIFAVVGLSIYFAYPPQEKINLGLDLKGGIHLLLQVETEKIPEKYREGAVDRAVEVIQNRIDQFGVREPYITKQGKDRIVVQLPGLTDQERARQIVGQTAHLEFKLVSDDEKIIKDALAGTIPQGFEVKQMEDEGKLTDTLILEAEPVLVGDKLTNASVGFDQYGQSMVEVQFDKEGAKIFDTVTFQNIGKRLAIVLDGKVHSAPVIRDRIPNGRGQISGNFTVEQASDLALVLNAGALPAPVKIIEERAVGPTLGQDSIRSGIYASLGGAVFVIIFMVAYYLLPGVIASFAVLLNLVILLGVLARTGASLTLPGIAGIILTIGMAVDANVLINERIREERKLGKAIRSVISAGYHKAFSAILDSNVTTILSALILLWFGTGPLRGFAVTLSIGLAASMFTAIFVTRVIFDFFTRERREIHLGMMNLIPEPKIDWAGKRWFGYAFSIVMVTVGLVGIFLKGPKQLSTDFTGGTVQEIHLNQPMDLGKIRSALIQAGLQDAQLQHYGRPEERNILIRTKSESTKVIQEALTSSVGQGKFEIRRSETVGPAASKELFGKALKAIGISLAIMLVYLAWRFQFIYGVCAIIPLIHDVVVSLGIFFLTGRDFSLPIVAAVLTIIGYSVNDTIVTLDRIREDVKIFRKEDFSKIVNMSINQTFGRTMITSTTALFGVLALLFFGGPAINDLAFILVVGFISGVYSTIFVAGPLLIDFIGKKKA